MSVILGVHTRVSVGVRSPNPVPRFAFHRGQLTEVLVCVCVCVEVGGVGVGAAAGAAEVIINGKGPEPSTGRIALLLKISDKRRAGQKITTNHMTER